MTVVTRCLVHGVVPGRHLYHTTLPTASKLAWPVCSTLLESQNFPEYSSNDVGFGAGAVRGRTPAGRQGSRGASGWALGFGRPRRLPGSGAAGTGEAGQGVAGVVHSGDNARQVLWCCDQAGWVPGSGCGCPVRVGERESAGSTGPGRSSRLRLGIGGRGCRW